MLQLLLQIRTLTLKVLQAVLVAWSQKPSSYSGFHVHTANTLAANLLGFTRLFMIGRLACLARAVSLTLSTATGIQPVVQRRRMPGACVPTLKKGHGGGALQLTLDRCDPLFASDFTLFSPAMRHEEKPTTGSSVSVGFCLALFESLFVQDQTKNR